MQHPTAGVMVSEEEIRDLLTPYVVGLTLPEGLYAQCHTYLELLLRWNERTNLTAVRDPAALVTRQLGESLFAARLVGPAGSLLDVGSGAGFPGIPLQLAWPGLQVTLAESQGKKAAFLRQAVRTLGLPCTVWAARVELLPPNLRFDWVTMRAVDRSAAMEKVVRPRVHAGGWLLRYVAHDEPLPGEDWRVCDDMQVPGSSGRLLRQQAVTHEPVPSGGSTHE